MNGGTFATYINYRCGGNRNALYFRLGPYKVNRSLPLAYFSYLVYIISCVREASTVQNKAEKMTPEGSWPTS